MNCRTIKDWRRELDRVLLEMRDALWDGPTDEEYSGVIVGESARDMVFFNVFKKKKWKYGKSENKLEKEVNSLL